MTTDTARPLSVPPGGAVDEGAALRNVLNRLGDKWTVIVICRLDGGPMRFNELRRATGGITQRMLTGTLRHLERDGLVTRTVRPTVPPQVEYALTPGGRSLHAVLYRLVEWTEQNIADIAAAQSRYDEAAASATASAGVGRTDP
jgi:DNA-binding HxlR family transcriptional regulator